MSLEETSRWLIRISVLCYVVCVSKRLLYPADRWSTLELLVWTVGCAACWAHIVSAIAAFHQWSHARAIEFTAEETYRVTGIRNGSGIWFNYLFVLLWTLDCYRRLRDRLRLKPPNSPGSTSVNVFFLFIMFFATVVFGPEPYRYAFVLLSLILLTAVVFRTRLIQSQNEE